MKVDIIAGVRMVGNLDLDDQLENLAKNDELWDAPRDEITTKLSEIVTRDATVDDPIADCEFDLDWRSCELTDDEWDDWLSAIRREQHRRRNVGQYDIFGGVVEP